MSIQEINELTLEQVLPMILFRLDLPEDQEATQEQIQAEFDVYIQELILVEETRLAEEEARLAELARIQDLRDRFAALSDKGLIQGETGISNPAAYFRDSILKNPNKDKAEQFMQGLESAHQAGIEKYHLGGNLDPNWAALRSAREAILRDTDWTQLADAPVTTSERTMYREYRQYLRDLPTQYNAESIHLWKVKSFEEWKNWKYPS